MGEVIVGQGLGILDQRSNFEIITRSCGVLKVSEGIYPDRKRGEPGPFRDVGHRGQCVRSENLSVTRREDDKCIVILAESILELLKGLQVCVLATEKHTVVIGESEELTTGGDRQHQKKRQENRRGAITGNPVAPG